MTNTPTHARTELGTDAHKHPKRAEVRCITFPILFLMAVPQKKACGVPPTSSACVCVCVWVERVCVCVSARGLTQLFHVAAMLMSGGDAEAWERWLSSAKPIIHSHLNIYTSAGMTRCSCQRARKQWTHAPTGTRVHAHLCARKESSHRPLHPQTTTHWHTQADPGETNPLSAGMLSLHQIDKRSRGFSFQSCNTLVNCNHCASFYAVDREHKPAVKHNIYFPQPN